MVATTTRGEKALLFLQQQQNNKQKSKNVQSRCVRHVFLRKDEVVVPRDSAVFSDAPSVPFEYTEEKSSKLLNVRETKFYLNEEDGLCLRELDEKNRMKIDVVPDAHHMQFRWNGSPKMSSRNI